MNQEFKSPSLWYPTKKTFMFSVMHQRLNSINKKHQMEQHRRKRMHQQETSSAVTPFLLNNNSPHYQ